MDASQNTTKTTPKPLAKSAQTPLTKKQFSDRVIDLLNKTEWRSLTGTGALPVGMTVEDLESNGAIAEGVRYTFYDDDKRKWVITKTTAHDGFQEVSAKTMYPYTDGSYADFDGSAVGTRKGWFEVEDGRWRSVGLYG